MYIGVCGGVTAVKSPVSSGNVEPGARTLTPFLHLYRVFGLEVCELGENLTAFTPNATGKPLEEEKEVQ